MFIFHKVKKSLYCNKSDLRATTIMLARQFLVKDSNNGPIQIITIKLKKELKNEANLKKIKEDENLF